MPWAFGRISVTVEFAFTSYPKQWLCQLCVCFGISDL
jgi:hypothetical protein